MAASAQELGSGLLRALLDGAVVGVALFRPVDGDSDLTAVYANDAYQAFKPHVPMVGSRFSHIFPENATAFLPRMRSVLETGRPWTAHNSCFEYERSPGRMYRGYFTFNVRRIRLDGGWALVTEVLETTAELEARQHATRQLEITHLLLQTSRVLAEHVELHAVLTELAEVLLSSTAHTRSFVFTWDEDARLLTYAAAAGKEAFAGGQTFTFDDLSEVTKQVVRQRRTAVVDFDVLPPAARGRALAAQKSHVLLDVPVLWHDQLVALLGVDDPGERREFTPREIEIVEGIAAQAATAIENARLFGEREQSLRALEEKDRDIRQAYSDVIDAVTGGRLILLGSDELGEALCEPLGETRDVREAEDITRARPYLREVLAGLPCLEDVVLAFSEAATNMLKHAGGGTYRVGLDRRRVRIVLSDHGSGIDFHDLPKATLVSGYSTKQTLGMGFTLMMELTDRLLLSTDSRGTTLVLERDLGKGSRC